MKRTFEQAVSSVDICFHCGITTYRKTSTSFDVSAPNAQTDRHISGAVDQAHVHPIKSRCRRLRCYCSGASTRMVDMHNRKIDTSPGGNGTRLTNAFNACSIFCGFALGSMASKSGSMFPLLHEFCLRCNRKPSYVEEVYHGFLQGTPSSLKIMDAIRTLEARVISNWSKRANPQHDPLGLVTNLKKLPTFLFEHGDPESFVVCDWTGIRTKQWMHWYSHDRTRRWTLDKDFVLSWIVPAWMYVHFLRWCVQCPHKSPTEMEMDFIKLERVWSDFDAPAPAT